MSTDQMPIPIYEQEINFSCKISFDGKNLSITAPETPEASFIYAFKVFQMLCAIEENSKIKAKKKLFTSQEKISITQARHITRKVMNQLYEKVFRGIPKPKIEVIAEETK